MVFGGGFVFKMEVLSCVGFDGFIDGCTVCEGGGIVQKYLEFNDGQSHKFWCIEVQGGAFAVIYGKVGSSGQKQCKSFADEAQAQKEALRLVGSKLKKGYVEKEAPESFRQMALQAKQQPVSMPMPQVPVPKERVLPPAGPEVVDDGSPRPWAQEREYADEDEGDVFALDFLRKPEVVDVKTLAERDVVKSAEVRACAGTGTAADDGYDEAAFSEAQSVFLKVMKRGRGKLGAAELVENMKKANPSDGQLKDAFMKALNYMFSDDLWAISMQHIDVLPIIAGAGVDIGAYYAQMKGKGYFDEDDVKPLFRHIAKVNPPAEKMAEEVDKAMNKLYQKAAGMALDQLKEVVERIKAGKQEHIDGKRFPEQETGFMINADSAVSIYSVVERDRLSRADFDEGDDIRGAVIKHYLAPLLKPELERLTSAGFFDEIANGYIWIGLYSDKEALVERRLDEEMLAGKAVELERVLRQLEATHDFIGHADLLKESVQLYLRNNGIIADKDTDRILALLVRFLYSGDAKPEEVARDLINTYDYLDVPKWTLEYVKFFYANFDYQWAKQRLEYVIDHYDYAPAKEQMKAWRFSAGPEDDHGEDGVDYEDLYGYGGDANRAHHRDVFDERDVFVETDTVIARAMSNGHIFIRFKKEGEQGYSDALDWLNRLMGKGYSKIHDGYELSVRFLAEPMFFEEFREMMDGYMWPDNDSHAFFCKAVHYPALRDKVAEFARLTLHEYDRYLDLDGEYSTVAGTFAAVAAAMSDVKYMDVAVKYGEETDGEHEEMASHFADILEEHWGLTPETAVAVAVLTMSYDHDNLGLSDAYYKIPQILEVVMGYFASTKMHHKAYKIMRLAQNIFPDLEEGDGILKKVKKLFKTASDSRAKQVYADFYNLYLEAVEEEEGDGYGEPIDYQASILQAPLPGDMDEELAEDPPCVITVAEAKMRGFKDDEFHDEDDAPWCVLVFAPITITNPYIHDFCKANELKRKKIDPLCYRVRNPCKCYTFGKKVAIDLTGAPYQYGMVVYDKKQAAILYGLYDYAEVAAKLAKKRVDPAQMQALKQKYYFMACPQGSPKESLESPAARLLDEAHDAIIAERYMRTVMKLERIRPEDGVFYDASLLVMADMMRMKKDKDALRRVYETAQARMPQYSAYWQAKLSDL